MYYAFGQTVEEIPARLEKRIMEHCVITPFLNPPIVLAFSDWINSEIDDKFPHGSHDGRIAMWSRVYEGGRTLAQYILNNPSHFIGKNVLDIGSGSGIVAIAAAKVGAHVLAIDSNPVARYAIQINARNNQVKLNSVYEAATNKSLYREADIITAADVFYYSYDLKKGTLANTLKEQADFGKTVYATSSDIDLDHLFNAFDGSIEEIQACSFGRMSFIKMMKDEELPAIVDTTIIPHRPKPKLRFKNRFTLKK